MPDDGPMWRDWDGELYTLDELRGIWFDDLGNIRSYRAQGNEDGMSDEEFEDRYSFERWLEEIGTYYPVEDDDEDEKSGGARGQDN
jgi:hypothetical protein